MPDQDGGLVEGTDLRLVVVDDLGQAKALELLCVLALPGDACRLAWPLGGRDLVAAALEVLGEILPAVRSKLCPMDKHQRWSMNDGLFQDGTSQIDDRWTLARLDLQCRCSAIAH